MGLFVDQPTDVADAYWRQKFIHEDPAELQPVGYNLQLLGLSEAISHFNMVKWNHTDFFCIPYEAMTVMAAAECGNT